MADAAAPNLMIATATILALTPLATGVTEGALAAAELTTVVSGGQFPATLLTPLIVPVMPSLLDKLIRPGRWQDRETTSPAE